MVCVQFHLKFSEKLEWLQSLFHILKRDKTRILSRTHKKTIFVFNFPDNCISAKSAPQILSIKYEYIFHFSIVSMIGLPNSLANYLFGAILITPPKADSFTSVVNYLSKKLWRSKAPLISIIFRIFLKIKSFITKVLSTKILLGKS